MLNHTNINNNNDDNNDNNMQLQQLTHLGTISVITDNDNDEVLALGGGLAGLRELAHLGQEVL